jgi:hypothetical protein
MKALAEGWRLDGDGDGVGGMEGLAPDSER